MKTITRSYLNKHKTSKGGYTKAQARALGVEWPLEKGWQSKVIGNQLTEEQKTIFESPRNAIKHAKDFSRNPHHFQRKVTSSRLDQEIIKTLAWASNKAKLGALRLLGASNSKSLNPSSFEKAES